MKTQYSLYEKETDYSLMIFFGSKNFPYYICRLKFKLWIIIKDTTILNLIIKENSKKWIIIYFQFNNK